MKRRYIKFPEGLPAVGLLLLRSAVGLRLVFEGLRCVLNSQALNPTAWVLGLVALLIGISFALGFLTPLAGTICALAATAVWLWHPAWISALGDFASLNTIVVAIAILLLGPGAISLDAYLFGRRRIIIPPAVRP